MRIYADFRSDAQVYHHDFKGSSHVQISRRNSLCLLKFAFKLIIVFVVAPCLRLQFLTSSIESCCNEATKSPIIDSHIPMVSVPSLK